MLWQDILVRRRLSREQITAAISQIFLVEAADVLIVDEIDPGLPTSPRVLVEATETDGEFPLLLSIYIRDEETKQPLIEGAIQFAALCGCPCLISDDSANPYRMNLVLPDGRSTPVALDAIELEHGRYTLDLRRTPKGLLRSLGLNDD